jgi:hypothetical protein
VKRVAGVVFLVAALAANTAAKRPVKFAVLGDVHLGLRGADRGIKMTASSPRLLQMAIDQLNAIPDLDFVVFDGDLVVDAEAFNFDRLKEMADELHAPYFVVLGNHDLPLVPPERHWSTASRPFYPGESRATVAAIFRGHGFGGDGNTFWSADLAGVHLVGLDSPTVGDWGGNIPRVQLAWLEKDLAKARGPSLIFLHHNLVESHPELTIHPNFLVKNAAEVKKLLSSRPSVKAVIAAHYHFTDAHVEDGIAYLTTPSIQTWPLRFALFELDEKELRMRTIPVGEGANAAEAEGIRARARSVLFDDEWKELLRAGLERAGRPHGDDETRAELYRLFEAKPDTTFPLRR